MPTKQPIEYFSAKIGGYATYTNLQNREVSIEVTEANYQNMFTMQDYGWSFKADRPRVHQGPGDSTCVSCEG